MSMRKIKFRAWDPIDKKMWFTGQEGETDEKTDGTFQLYFDENGCLTAKLLWIDDVGSEHPMVTDRDLILMQYTGLNDKIGVAIFDGDIVRVYGLNGFSWLYEIKFEFGGYWLDEENCLGAVNNYCEVIGNISENPELLGETE